MTSFFCRRFTKILTMCVLLSAVALAQTPGEQAWEILKTGISSTKSDTRANTARALALVTNDAKVVELLDQALEDKDADVRSAAATSLGTLKAKSSIPKMIEIAKKETDGDVVMAIAKALTEMGQEKGYEVFYAVVTGERKSGQGLMASQEKMMTDTLKNPKAMANVAFQQGMGFVPFGGVALGAFQAVRANGKNQALVKAAAVKTLGHDPDPRSTKAIVGATTDKEWIVRAAAFDALARRGDSAVVPDIMNGLSDKEDVVQLTAAAAIMHLADIPSKGRK